MRILCIDDNPALVQSLKKGLEKEDYAVDITYDGEHGLLLAQSIPYEVIVLDWILPKIGGLKVLELLHEQKTTASILLLVDPQLLENKPSRVPDSVDDYLIKPFHFEELLSHIQKLIRQRVQKIVPVIELENLKINTVSRQVWLKGEEIVLPSIEYQILEFLACHPNEVITRHTLWTQLYQWQDETFSDLLDGYVNQLHLKLDQDRPARLIRVIRDEGFMLKV